MTIDVTKLCEARSDQLNAIDLVSGPRVVKITDVKIVSGEQPIHVVLDGDSKRPWKCSKSSVRVLAACYGVDANNWIGKHIEIYCDETVVWGGMQVGGVRQSKAEGLSKPLRVMLTKSRQKKEATVINPLSSDDIAKKYGKQPTETTMESVKDAAAITNINRDQLRADMERLADDAAGKAEWWKGLSAEERAAVKEMAAQ